MSYAPRLETERLILRAHTRADLDASAAMWSAPEVTRFISGKPSTREESWGRMLRYPGLWAFLGYGYWAIAEKATGRFVGEAGFGDFERDISPSFDGAPEHGWAFAPAAQGMGYATEAGHAALAWAKTQFGAREVVCMISLENIASLRVAAKLGYVEYARADFRGGPNILMRRLL